MKTKWRRSCGLFLAILILATAALGPGVSWADPCGMVPPVYLGEQVPIERIGLQQTYVFFKDGVETIVLRPGFTGNIDEFGMLIPFPSPPAMRKMPDHIFSHLAAAVDPPEVVVDMRWWGKSRGYDDGPVTDEVEADAGLKYEADRVRVIRQEAVGMYEVAVLEAGSAAALKRWMDNHGFQYPDGMDSACDDYVEEGWCFVAVKTKVGQKAGADPKPGQREVNEELPPGSSFDGHVQAMGFRFRVDELVVPMRLATFNEGELRNVVYVLAEGPRRVRDIPSEFVVRQISGDDLYRNVTGPLPLRIIGGKAKNLPDSYQTWLPQSRKPEPHNGAAKELFAADLMALQSGELALPHEEREKVLLRIGERMGLRGPRIDRLHEEALAAERQRTIDNVLAELKMMTLTVIDGDFPRDVLARQNLRFGEYMMSARRNTPDLYDAKQHAAKSPLEGVVYLESLSSSDLDSSDEEPDKTSYFGPRKRSWLVAMLLTAGFAFVAVRRKRFPGRRTGTSLLLIAWALAALEIAVADEPPPPQTSPSRKEAGTRQDDPSVVRKLIARLSDAEKADRTVAALVALGDEAVPLLSGEAIEGNDLERRGWAIACLAEIGGAEAAATLRRVHRDPQQSMLVRTWAAAGSLAMMESMKEIVENAPLLQQFPALERPFGLRILAELDRTNQPASPEKLLQLSLTFPLLQSAIAPRLRDIEAAELTTAMATAEDQNVRRQAAAYLAAIAWQGPKRHQEVSQAIVEQCRFDGEATDVPWSGGPLFVPAVAWNQRHGRQLVGDLIRWHLWCDRHDKLEEKTQIHNNIRSWTLAQAAGYQSPGFQEVDTVAWLTVWREAMGRDEVQEILREQGVVDDDKYSEAL